MINLIYKAFPYGNAETFASYELQYAKQIFKDDLRIISLYSGTIDNNINKERIGTDVINIRLGIFDYLLAFLSCVSLDGLKEIKEVHDRKCKDKIVKCLWRIIYYRAYGYALRGAMNRLKLTEEEVFICYWMNECAYAATFLKKWYPNIKVYSRGHGFDVYEERCFLPFRKMLFNKLDSVYLVNNAEREYLINSYGTKLDTRKIKVSHLGIEIPDHFTTSAKRDKFIIASCSSVIQLKRLDLLIEAMSTILDFDFTWIHIGDGILLNEMKELAKEKLIHENQHYEFLGQLTLADVHKAYREREISLFVNCSDTEGIPVSIMEAMSYGVPVVARDIGGISEIVDNSCGLIVGETDIINNLARAIRYIHSIDECKYIDMRTNAHNKIKKEFNAETQYNSLFNEIYHYGK